MKVKKIAIAAIISVLVISMTTGCFNNDSDVSNIVSEQNNSSTDVSKAEEESSVEYPEDYWVNPNVEVVSGKKGCLKLLEEIHDYPAGTAGSSLKCVGLAADVLNWTELNEMKAKEISAIVKEYIKTLNEHEKSVFKQHFEIIDSCVDEILDGNKDTLASIAYSSSKLKFEQYSKKKYDVFEDAVEEQLENIPDLNDDDDYMG